LLKDGRIERSLRMITKGCGVSFYVDKTVWELTVAIILQLFE
jgi:hypothetical protein